QQQGDHHARMKRRLAARLALVVGEEGSEVDRGDGVEEEVDEVVLGEPILGRGGEEVGLVGGPRAIRLADATLERATKRPIFIMLSYHRIFYPKGNTRTGS